MIFLRWSFHRYCWPSFSLNRDTNLHIFLALVGASSIFFTERQRRWLDVRMKRVNILVDVDRFRLLRSLRRKLLYFETFSIEGIKDSNLYTFFEKLSSFREVLRYKLLRVSTFSTLLARLCEPSSIYPIAKVALNGQQIANCVVQNIIYLNWNIHALWTYWNYKKI